MKKVNRIAPKRIVSFEVDIAELETVNLIVSRACAMAQSAGWTYERMDATMDIKACHANGNPLRLADLLEADDFNFAHDVFGIRRHLDRGTGYLMDCFVPRFSA